MAPKPALKRAPSGASAASGPASGSSRSLRSLDTPTPSSPGAKGAGGQSGRSSPPPRLTASPAPHTAPPDSPAPPAAAAAGPAPAGIVRQGSGGVGPDASEPARVPRLGVRVFQPSSIVSQHHSFLVGSTTGGLTDVLERLDLVDPDMTLTDLRPVLEVRKVDKMNRRSPLFQEILEILNCLRNYHDRPEADRRKYYLARAAPGAAETNLLEDLLIIPPEEEGNILAAELLPYCIVVPYFVVDPNVKPLQIAVDGPMATTAPSRPVDDDYDDGGSSSKWQD